MHLGIDCALAGGERGASNAQMHEHAHFSHAVQTFDLSKHAQMMGGAPGGQLVQLPNGQVVMQSSLDPSMVMMGGGQPQFQQQPQQQHQQPQQQQQQQHRQ